ncbi:unnamed protein product [Trichogramma brassicae]|uniref:Uncharacterized protein n=1 Tax=Trichogramma brassicae TaxID=86971 RepID=A0A6H5IA15_9HYME|nr:unnamed protein product [Trichogramma brassicae]
MQGHARSYTRGVLSYNWLASKRAIYRCAREFKDVPSFYYPSGSFRGIQHRYMSMKTRQHEWQVYIYVAEAARARLPRSAASRAECAARARCSHQRVVDPRRRQAPDPSSSQALPRVRFSTAASSTTSAGHSPRE